MATSDTIQTNRMPKQIECWHSLEIYMTGPSLEVMPAVVLGTTRVFKVVLGTTQGTTLLATLALKGTTQITVGAEVLYTYYVL